MRSPDLNSVHPTLASTEQAWRREAFFSRVGAELSSSLNPMLVLSKAARLAVPVLADWCVVDLLDGDFWIRSELAHAGPADEETARSLREVPVFDDSLNLWLHAACAQDRGIELKPDDSSLLALCAPLSPRAAFLVPLKCDGNTIGAMTFLMTRSEREFGAGDRDRIEGFAERVSLAIENARRHERTRKTLSTREQFISIATHELRNPVTAIKLQVGILDKLSRAEELPSETTEKLGRLAGALGKSVAKLEETINQLFDVARMRADQIRIIRAPCDLGELVVETVSALRGRLQAAGCTVGLQVESGVCGEWDRFRLGQVLENLIGNAAKYAPGHPIEIQLRPEGDRALFTIRDQGPGIPRSEQGGIFDCYVRGKETRGTTGLGIGLYLVKQIVDAHDGAIRLRSEQGQGAEFLVELPLYPRSNS